MKLEATPQFAQGKETEATLDHYFTSLGYQINPLSEYEERIACLGDRRFTRDNRTIFVEYKSGMQTHYTGNVFLETVSVDTEYIPGWVYTCQADVIVYAILPSQKLLLFHPCDLREHVQDLRRRFPMVKTCKGQNTGYNTHGILVPLHVAETELAFKIIQL